MSSQEEYKDLLAKIKAVEALAATNRKLINKNKKILAALFNSKAIGYLNQLAEEHEITLRSKTNELR